MKVGILGAGFGSYHAQLYGKIEGVEVVRVFGRSEEKRRRIETELGLPTTQRAADILCDPEIELIDVCLPTSVHTEYILEALKNGKHVFCETPICYTLDEIALIRAAEQQSGKRVFVDLFAKFIPELAYVHDAIAKNKYGMLKVFTVTRKTPPIWGPLGLDKIATNLMLHDLDASVWLFGKPKSTHAAGIALGSDKAHIKAILNYDEAIVEVEASSMMPESFPFTVSYEAVFEKGTLQFIQTSTDEGEKSSLIEYADGKTELTLQSANPYESAIRHVLSCISEGRETIVGVDEAEQALSIAIETTNALTKTQ
jgi:predicted dehydrogenase